MNKLTCNRCIMDNVRDNTFSLDEHGYCNYCTDALRRLPSEYFPSEIGKIKLNAIIDRIKADGAGKEYDCMVGVSGGVDSSYVVYLGYTYGLRMIAIHIDDGLDTEIATNNIKYLCEKAKVKLIIVKPDKDQFADLTLSFLKAGVPNLALPQDNIIYSAINDTVKKFKIDYILSGANFSLECILERGADNINASDKKHIKAIHKQFGTKPINKLRLLSLFENYIGLRYFSKIENVLPLNYINYNLNSALNELGDFSNFVYYGGKHYESILTRFLQCYYLPEKYGFDKRKSHFSSLIVTGQMSRKDALERIAMPAYISDELKEFDFNFIANYLSLSRKEIDALIMQPAKNHHDYPISQLNKLGWVSRKFRRYLG